MNISKQRHKNYISISKNESFILSLIKTHDLTVFNIRELKSLSGWDTNRIHNTLFTLVKKNMLIRIKRNMYTLPDYLNEKIFKIATETVVPSYISFWTALSHYGFTEQQIQIVQQVSTKQTKEIRIDSHKIQITTFQPNEFFGYTKIDGFVIAEKEKSLIDSLFKLEKCGGFNEFVKCLYNAWEQVNKKRLILYLKMFHNKSLNSRMGYLIEQLELNHTSILKSLEKEKSICPIKLNPQKKKYGKYNKKWNVLINDTMIIEDII
jgi:predicted transcriptional regulator of viral defense system